LSRWFRYYDGTLDDPKVQKLDPPLFKMWVNLLCIASRNGGNLPLTDDLAFSLRISVKDTSKVIEQLTAAGLLDAGDPVRPHNWDERQYQSDSSTGRVKRFRQRSTKQSGNGGGNVGGNGNVTPDETAPEQSRAETEQSRAAAPAGWDERYPMVRSECERILSNPNCLVWGRVNAWLQQGADPDQDIYPTMVRLKAKWRGTKLEFFDGAIADAIATRTKPLPAGTPRAGALHAEIDPAIYEENQWFGRLTTAAALKRWDPKWGQQEHIPKHIREKFPELIARLPKPKEAA
jgi:hypothetical protein